MHGPPEDVVGECNARLFLSDDYGDNHCTIRCGLPDGHEGSHKEEFERDDKPVVITFDCDQRDSE